MLYTTNKYTNNIVKQSAFPAYIQNNALYFSSVSLNSLILLIFCNISDYGRNEVMERENRDDSAVIVMVGSSIITTKSF